MKEQPFKKGDWVAQKDTRYPHMGVVKDCYDLDGEWLIDIVLWDWEGNEVGRESPPEGGPRTFEPACPADQYRRIQKPSFPLRRDLSGGWAYRLKFE